MRFGVEAGQNLAGIREKKKRKKKRRTVGGAAAGPGASSASPMLTDTELTSQHALADSLRLDDMGMSVAVPPPRPSPPATPRHASGS